MSIHFKNKSFMLWISVLLTGCNAASQNDAPQASQAAKPNIIFVLADDLGYGDIRYLNKESKIPTPHLDGLARQGICFTDAHSGSAVCTPTRYGILTGRYAFRTRLKQGVLWGYSPPLIEPGRTTVASFLKENDYHTACIGKWHLGLDWPRKNPSQPVPDIGSEGVASTDFEDNVDYSSDIKGGPADHGFDDSFILPASLDMSPYCYIRNRRVAEAPTAFTQGKNPAEAGRGVFWRAGKKSLGFDFDQVLPTLMEEATQYIDRQSGQQTDQPFFLYLALSAPHTPWLPDQASQGASEADRYGDFVVMVDQMMGRLLATLKKNRLEDNTLLIFTSDNGAHWTPDDIAATRHQANYIFRGQKADIYEGGHRIPYIARWPGIIPGGTFSNQTLCTTDLLATLTGILNQPLPKNAGEDSYNMWEAFKGNAPHSPIREATVHHSAMGFFAIRQGRWKLTTRLGSGGFSDPKTIEPQAGEAPGTLYDLENDPEETQNLYLERPEIVEKLSALLEQYQKQGYSRPL